MEPVDIFPPQKFPLKYDKISETEAFGTGAISAMETSELIPLSSIVYLYGGSVPLQPVVLKVTSMILLFCIRVGLKPYHQRPRTRCVTINSKIQNITLNSSSWSGSSAPYSYTVSNADITSTSKVVEIMPANGATNEQLQAYLSAGLCGGATGTNTITIKAFGKKPATNIPITIVVRGEI